MKYITFYLKNSVEPIALGSVFFGEQQCFYQLVWYFRDAERDIPYGWQLAERLFFFVHDACNQLVPEIVEKPHQEDFWKFVGKRLPPELAMTEALGVSTLVELDNLRRIQAMQQSDAKEMNSPMDDLWNED